MTKVHGKRYAYKFDFQGLATATQPANNDPNSYKYQTELFMSSYHQSAKLGGFMSSHGTIPSSAGKKENCSITFLENRKECHISYDFCFLIHNDMGYGFIEKIGIFSVTHLVNIMRGATSIRAVC